MNWTSKPDSGRSVDNLAPAAPVNLATEQSFEPEGLQLTWDPNIEGDLAGYNIYRGIGSGFPADAGSFIAFIADPEYFDDEWMWESGWSYKVMAVDIHGNESPWALAGPGGVTGGDPILLPEATFLAQNYPNPFNPSTTIVFGLKTEGFVTLSIYDAAGRLIAELINESRPAGQYSAVWNGKVQNGSSAASGVYFYKLMIGEFLETRKMILLR
jgi:hypothetical protein